jgi:alpha-tubulin suppressor-like RCC1 family protein
MGLSAKLRGKDNRTTYGTLWGWGTDGGGTLCNQNVVAYIDIVSRTAWTASVTSYCASLSSAGVTILKTNGTLWMWGLNNSGALGDGTQVAKSSPIQVGSNTDWASVSFTDAHVMALKTDGSLWGWGSNGSGAVGNNTSSTVKTSPVQVLGSLTTWAKAAAGVSHTVAVRTDGTLWTWGIGTGGQLGDGTTVTKSSPVQVGSLSDWADVQVNSSAIARKTDGTLWTWGFGTNGQLGDGTNTTKSSPVQVGSGTYWSTIQAISTLSAATRTDGSLWVFGNNSTGIVTISVNSPVQVGTTVGWVLDAGSGNTRQQLFPRRIN